MIVAVWLADGHYVSYHYMFYYESLSRLPRTVTYIHIRVRVDT